MKKTIKIIAIAIFICTQSCSQNNIGNHTSGEIKMLTRFYTLYYSKWDNEKSLDSLKRIYLTKELYNKITEYTLSGQLDYDPIVNGQDIDEDWKKKLKIKFNPNDSMYEMYMTSNFNNKEIHSFLKLKKEKNGYVICDIKVNDILSMIEMSNKSERNNFSQKWIGKYSAWFSYGKIGGENAGWALEITITKDSLKATGDGYQMGFVDELSGVEDGNKLILNHKKNIDGYTLGEKMKPEFTLLRENKKYYMKSDWIDHDVITKSQKLGYEIKKENSSSEQ